MYRDKEKQRDKDRYARRQDKLGTCQRNDYQNSDSQDREQSRCKGKDRRVNA